MTKLELRLAPLLLVTLIPVAAMADLPDRSPHDLHALSDPRAARCLIEHRPGDAKVGADEDGAITRIGEAINEIKRAAIDGGNDIHSHPQVDDTMDRRGRQHRADELRLAVHSDIAREEDDPLTRGLRERAV